jgi:hypothetical protein
VSATCRNCNVPLADYPRARDGFCVPSHADGGDNRLEMEAGSDALAREDAIARTMDRVRTIVDEACGLQTGTDEERLTELERVLFELRRERDEEARRHRTWKAACELKQAEVDAARRALGEARGLLREAQGYLPLSAEALSRRIDAALSPAGAGKTVPMEVTETPCIDRLGHMWPAGELTCIRCGLVRARDPGGARCVKCGKTLPPGPQHVDGLCGTCFLRGAR